MGRRSNFERRPSDFYATPAAGVIPLLRHLRPGAVYDEPCAGDGALIHHLFAAGHTCGWFADLEPRGDGIPTFDARFIEHSPSGMFISNPPWSRPILHALIDRLSRLAPTWLLIDSNWANTKQAAPFIPYCRIIQPVGRLIWIPETKMTGKDDCSWFLFDQTTPSPTAGPVFFPRMT